MTHSTTGLDGQEIQWPENTLWPPPADVVPAFESLADFGPSVASVEVDAALIGKLQTFLETYLQFVVKSRNLPFNLAAPDQSNYRATVDNVQWPDQALPAILVATAHTSNEQSTISGDDKYITSWLADVSCVVRGPNPAQVKLNASYTELAFRLALIHQAADPSGIIRDIRWQGGGQVRPLQVRGDNAGRYLAEGASSFIVFTDAAAQAGVGPNTPGFPDYGALPLVEVFDIDIEGASNNPGGS